MSFETVNRYFFYNCDIKKKKYMKIITMLILSLL